CDRSFVVAYRDETGRDVAGTRSSMSREASQRAQLLGRVLASEAVFAAIAIVITLLRHRPPAALLVAGRPALEQLGVGLVAGVLMGAAAAWLLLAAPFLEAARGLLTSLARTSGIRAGDVPALAIAAGVGEELLFRGALQSWLGLAWATA